MLQSQPSKYQRQPLPLGVMHVSSQRGSSTGMRKTIPSLTPSLTIYPQVMLFIAISNIVLLCPILSSFLLIRLTFFFQQMRFKLDRKMMQLDKHALMFFSLLCDSIGTTLENLTLKARLTMKSPKHLQWNILQMKTGQPSLNTGLIQSIR